MPPVRICWAKAARRSTWYRWWRSCRWEWIQEKYQDNHLYQASKKGRLSCLVDARMPLPMACVVVLNRLAMWVCCWIGARSRRRPLGVWIRRKMNSEENNVRNSAGIMVCVVLNSLPMWVCCWIGTRSRRRPLGAWIWRKRIWGILQEQWCVPGMLHQPWRGRHPRCDSLKECLQLLCGAWLQMPWGLLLPRWMCWCKICRARQQLEGCHTRLLGFGAWGLV